MSQSRPVFSLADLITLLKVYIQRQNLAQTELAKQKQDNELNKLNKLIADLEEIHAAATAKQQPDEVLQRQIKSLLTAALVDAYVHEKRTKSLLTRVNILGPKVKLYQAIIVEPLKGSDNFLLPANYYNTKHDSNDFVDIYLNSIVDDEALVKNLFLMNMKYFKAAVDTAKVNEKAHEVARENLVSIEKILARLSPAELVLWNQYVKAMLPNPDTEAEFLVETDAAGKALLSGETETRDHYKKTFETFGTDTKHSQILADVGNILTTLESQNQTDVAEQKEVAVTAPSVAAVSLTDSTVRVDMLTAFAPKPLTTTESPSSKSKGERKDHEDDFTTSSPSNITPGTSPRQLIGVTTTTATTSLLLDNLRVSSSPTASSRTIKPTTLAVINEVASTTSGVPLVSVSSSIPPAPPASAVPPPPPPVAAVTLPKLSDTLQQQILAAKTPKIPALTLEEQLQAKRREREAAKSAVSVAPVSSSTPPAPPASAVPPPPPFENTIGASAPPPPPPPSETTISASVPPPPSVAANTQPASLLDQIKAGKTASKAIGSATIKQQIAANQRLKREQAEKAAAAAAAPVVTSTPTSPLGGSLFAGADFKRVMAERMKRSEATAANTQSNGGPRAGGSGATG
jgi:hypothetical protein